jgi:hypothetical protein
MSIPFPELERRGGQPLGDSVEDRLGDVPSSSQAHEGESCGL